MSQSTDLTAPFAAGTPIQDDWEAAFAACRPEPDINNEPRKWGAWDFRCMRFDEFVMDKAYLDAADLLRPEGWDFGFVIQSCTGRFECRLERSDEITEGIAPTEACARAIAAIRAREAG